MIEKYILKLIKNNYMASFIILIALFELYLSFKKPLYGFSCLLVVKILIPDNVRFPAGDLSLNTVCSMLLFCSWLLKAGLWRKRYPSDTKMMWYILGFIFFWGFTILLTYTSVPLEAQFKPYFGYVVLQLLPIVVMIDVIRCKSDLQLLLQCFLVSSVICVVYSVGCFVSGIPYPYNDMVNSFFPGRDTDIELVMSSEMGGIAGRCMGTATSGTWDYGMVVTALFLCIGSIALFLKNKIWNIVWILFGIDVLCTIRRSPIIASMIFLLLIFLLSNRKSLSKKILYLICGGGILAAVVYVFPQLSTFRHILESAMFFWDDSVSAKNEVTGTSVSYRVYQLKRTMELISDTPIFGNGWGSCYYRALHRDMNGWESIVFTTLMQFGYFGFLIWMHMFYRFYRYSLKSKLRVISLAFMVASLAFCILNDTIYPFYIFFGAVLINKLSYMERTCVKCK